MYQSLLESLCKVSAPRIEGKKVYPAHFLLLIVFLSTLSGATPLGMRLKIMPRNTKKN